MPELLRLLDAEEARPIEEAAAAYVAAIQKTVADLGEVEGGALIVAVANGAISLLRAFARATEVMQGESELALGAAVGVLMASHDCPACAIARVTQTAVIAAKQLGAEMHTHQGESPKASVH